MPPEWADSILSPLVTSSLMLSSLQVWSVWFLLKLLEVKVSIFCFLPLHQYPTPSKGRYETLLEMDESSFLYGLRGELRPRDSDSFSFYTYLLWNPIHAFTGADEVLHWKGKKAFAMCLRILGSPKYIHLFCTYPQIPNALFLPNFHRLDSKEHKKDSRRLESALRNDRAPFTWLKIRCKTWRGSQNHLEVKAGF